MAFRTIIWGQFLKGTTAFAYKCHSLFTSSHPNLARSEPELPAPMVALVATTVVADLPYSFNSSLTILFQIFTSLREWESSLHAPTEFKTSAYLNVYEMHIRTLNMLSEKQPNRYHHLMSSLFTAIL